MVVCHERPMDVVLPCGHSFCKPCIQIVLDDCSGTIKCPVCSTESQAPDSRNADHLTPNKSAQQAYQVLLKASASYKRHQDGVAAVSTFGGSNIPKF
ncbi:hypothetical protein KIPB_012323, partial [Kipferlia bialata]|eukprot:g12323.t1